MSGSTHDQLSMVLADQRRELADLREERQARYRRIREIDAEEIVVLSGIRLTKEYIDNLQREGD